MNNTAKRLLNHAQRTQQAVTLVKSLSSVSVELKTGVDLLDDALVALDSHLDVVTAKLGRELLRPDA